MTALGFAFLSWILSIVACASCSYMVREAQSGGYYSYPDGNYGLFRVEADDGKCYPWDDFSIEDDSAVDAGRAFAVMTALFGSFILVLFVVGLFFNFPVMVWRTVMITEFVVAAFSLFSLSALGTEVCTAENIIYYDGCVPGEGGISSIFAFFFWITSGVLVCQMPVTGKPPFDICGGNCCNENCCNQGSTVSSVNSSIPTVTATPAGGQVLKTITTEVTHPDGRKTVTREEVVENS